MSILVFGRPVYRPYGIAVELYSTGQSAVVTFPVDTRKWLPGDAVYDGAIYIPADLSPGEYRVRVAMLDPRTRQPAIRLAIQGRQPDGWYDLGRITVE